MADTLFTEKAAGFVLTEAASTRKFTNHRVQFTTPELKEGFELEVYVNPNQISVFVNNGEAVITNTVYNPGENIETDVEVKIDTIA